MYVSPLFKFHRSKTWMYNSLAPHITNQLELQGIKTYVEVECRGLHNFLRLTEELEGKDLGINLNCPHNMFNHVYSDIVHNEEEFTYCLKALLFEHSTRDEATYFHEVRSKFNALERKDVEYTSKLAYLQIYSKLGTFRLNGEGYLASPYGNEYQPVTVELVGDFVSKIAASLSRFNIAFTGWTQTELVSIYREQGKLEDALFRLSPNIVLAKPYNKGVERQKEILDAYRDTNFIFNDFSVPSLRRHVETTNDRAKIFTETKSKVSSEVRRSNCPEMVVIGVVR